MANIVISGDTSGAITLQAPAVAGSTTLNLPASSGTILTSASPASDLPNSINGPAFSATQNVAQSVANNTWTKIPLQSEEFDTNNNFDSTTNYRFTPTVAGYYQVNGSVNYATSVLTGIAAIYKNNTEFKRGSQSGTAANSATGLIVSALIYLNGSTDYIELYGYQNSGGAVNTANSAAQTYFQASMVRSA